MKTGITVILTAYKRDHFGRQIPAILGQSVKPERTLIWQNENHVNIQYHKAAYNQISIVQSDHNFSYWGRFVLASLCDTEYVAIFDDDIIPGSRWFENCLRVSKEHNCIVGANGRDMQNGSGIYDRDTQYAFIGHCWFFKKEWLKYMFQLEPYTYETGEDIHFCACSKIFGNIPSWVPAQQGEFDSSLQDLGDDAHSSFKRTNHSPIRMEMIAHYRKLGWNV